MSGVEMVTVARADDGLRLDRWFRQHYPAVKQGQLQKMLRKGQVRVDGAKVEANRRLSPGEVVRVPPVPAATPAGKAAASAQDREEIRSFVLYEDDRLIAINKPFGLPVQGGSGVARHLDGMLDGLAKGGERPRLVHRLDKDTGGLMLLARDRLAAKDLTESFRRHLIEKTYWALVAGVPHPLEGTIDLPVEKGGPEGAERMGASEGGKKAITDYQTVEMAAGKAAFLALRPLTGRTHQLRVHMDAIGTPIVGDGKYGGERAKLEGVSKRMHLFCRTMSVPRDGKPPLELTAPLTGHMAKTWDFFAFPRDVEVEWPDR
ncbi:RluA family pseudouridine synthase [Parvularcula dongshanensis]|uniref:Pseudouridine synthase n=1 Tax=Parvularcula dongshanensis TaxID=1173995 RepID=A0A840I4C1_9PROT|nr:RluA family pseudouridine synthase [Parvularcula dongshanensis]MBB4659192.1 23S rRNA pseudouridine955/2504/2580 synthase [Parvularcula dongshanensis]